MHHAKRSQQPLCKVARLCGRFRERFAYNFGILLTFTNPVSYTMTEKGKDKIKSLRKENDQLKSELLQLKKEFEFLRNKMAEQKDGHREAEAAAAALPDEHDVQFLSDGYDLLLKSNTAMGDYLDNFARKLDSLQRNVDKIGKAVDEMLHYSYQYNFEVKEHESSQDTANLCLKLFSGLGVDVSITDIDIAHRVPLRNVTASNGHRRLPNPIVCKFTRRMVRDAVLASRGSVNDLTTDLLDLPSTAVMDRIVIYNHLTPKLQELLRAAKSC